MSVGVATDSSAGRPLPWAGHGRRLVIALVLLVLTVGSVALQAQQSAARHGRLSADEHAYLRLARDVVNRGNWGDLGLKQPFRWAPGAPTLFAAAAEVTGHPVDRHSAHDAQVVVGALLVPSVFLLGLLLTGPGPALAGATAAAIYVPLARATATAGTETLGALMITLAAAALVLSLRRDARRPAARFALAGAVLGLATLVRGDLVPVALLLPVAVAVALARVATPRSGLRAGVAMLLGAVALLAPWSLFASAHAHRFVPVTDGGAANLFIGTDLPADGTLFGVKRQFAAETRIAHPAVRHVKTFALREQLVLDAVARRYRGRGREAALTAAARDNLRRYALGHPLAFAGMEARKLWRMWGGPYAGTEHRLGAAVSWEHRALAALAFVGLLAGAIVTGDLALILLATFVALTTAVDVAFVSEARHNVRLMPVLLAAGAAGWWLAARRAPWNPRRRAGASGPTTPAAIGPRPHRA